MNIGKIGDYVKAHPWIAGTVVVVGGLILVFTTGWFGGGGSAEASVGSASGPTDAEVAANAQIAQTTIAGQIAALQSNNQVTLGNIAANVQTQHDTDALQLGLAQTAAALSLGSAQTAASQAIQLATITAQQQVQTQSISAQQDVANHQIQASEDATQSNNNLISSIIGAFSNPTPAPVSPQYTSIYDPGAVQDFLSKNPDVATVDYSHESKLKDLTREQFAINWWNTNGGSSSGRAL